MKSSDEQIKKIHVNASADYDVIIGRGLLSRVGQLISSVVKAEKIALVTDDKVDALYSDKVVKSLTTAGYQVVKFVFENGEKSKNLSTYGQILTFLSENDLTRTDAVVALGGGVVGDIAGFAAATFLRGIKCVQIPTTLLSQIDSSVGGKTGVDLPMGKNLVGAFHQPSLVICDVDTLVSLPEDIVMDGMGEAAKYTVLDEKIFNLINNGDYDIIDLVALSIDYKKRIVEADEFEGGKRKLLNLGHTPAHGIEKLSNYTISHGKAVAMGLMIILENSFRHKLIEEKIYTALINCVKKCCPSQIVPFGVAEICKAASNDKKRSGDTISLMMVYGVGDVREVNVKVDELKGYLK